MENVGGDLVRAESWYFESLYSLMNKDDVASCIHANIHYSKSLKAFTYTNPVYYKKISRY